MEEVIEVRDGREFRVMKLPPDRQTAPGAARKRALGGKVPGKRYPYRWVQLTRDHECDGCGKVLRAPADGPVELAPGEQIGSAFGRFNPRRGMTFLCTPCADKRGVALARKMLEGERQPRRPKQASDAQLRRLAVRFNDC